MISDVLFEAREDILGYLAGGLYGEREHWADIAAVVLAMEKLRLSPGYDISPSGTAPKLPDDPMEYLDQLVAERKASTVAEDDTTGACTRTHATTQQP
jgi:hypothetical protein